MRVPERCLEDLRTRGYFLLEGFLEREELAAAQEALWQHYPRPEEYFVDPAAHAWLSTGQWAGLLRGPWRSWALTRLAFHPDLVDLAERFLGSSDLRLYEAELWAKYAGAVDYNQCHHRDFVNHSLVVPKRSDPGTQMLSWILLSDVTEEDGPTKVVPLPAGDTVPYWPVEGDHDITNEYLPMGAFADEEVSMTGPAGTLVTFRSDTLHRGSHMTGERSARFALLANYDVWAPRWTGRVAWAQHATRREWFDLVERATPRERSLFGFPSPHDPYWDEQTLTDTQRRYPRMDLTPYRLRQGHGRGDMVRLSDGIVTLRRWSIEDASFMAEASADPAILRYSGTLDHFGYPAPPLATADAEAIIRQFTSSWETSAFAGKPGAGVAFAVADASSGELVGCCGLDDWSNTDVAQIGYWIAPETRGRGFAARAAALLTGWLFELGAARVVLKIVDDNDASERVARRAGFVYEGTLRSQGVWQGQRCDVRVFAALPHEWSSSQQA
jgi:RimJ/RimL family protein N-acetyltransferase